MNTFKHKSLYAALAGLGALGATGVAQAVSVNPDGLGQVLIYPYYTVRGVGTGVVGDTIAAYNSLLSVVNSTTSAKVVKVRFLEGKNSREVLDFNLYLSAKDVWTTAIIPTTDGAGIFTADKSCTVPKVSTSSDSPTPFVNYAFSGTTSDDKGGTTLDRTREGYVEIIEMGNVIGSTALTATHSSGVAPCTEALLVAPVAPGNTVAGSGGLFGSMTLINVLKGEDFGYDPTALDGFSTTPMWYDAGDIRPTLANVNPKTSVTVAGFNVYVTTGWPELLPAGNPVDPVSAVIMHNNVYNEFVLDVSTLSKTDWVVTFPTKREYVRAGTGAAIKLFQNNFTASGSCDDVTVTQYDREERQINNPGQFSPPPPTQTDALCWEANVLSYLYPSSAATPETSTVFGSKNFSTIKTPFTNGWAALAFNAVPSTGVHQLVGPPSTVFDTRTGAVIPPAAATTFNGLPVIGFSATVFENGTLTSGGVAVQSNYGGNYNHKLTRDISTGAPAAAAQ